MSRFNKGKLNPNFAGSGSASTSTSLRLIQKLNVARTSGQLNLSSLGLTSIPPEALDLRSDLLKSPQADGVKAWECYGEEMQTLVDLSDNPLEEVNPEELERDLERFKAVKKLRLRRCGLEAFKLPEFLEALAVLDLKDNQVKGGFMLDDLPRTIKELHIANNR